MPVKLLTVTRGAVKLCQTQRRGVTVPLAGLESSVTSVCIDQMSKSIASQVNEIHIRFFSTKRLKYYFTHFIMLSVRLKRRNIE